MAREMQVITEVERTEQIQTHHLHRIQPHTCMQVMHIDTCRCYFYVTTYTNVSFRLVLHCFCKMSGVTVGGFCTAPLEHVHLTVLTFRLTHEIFVYCLHLTFILTYAGRFVH